MSSLGQERQQHMLLPQIVTEHGALLWHWQQRVGNKELNAWIVYIRLFSVPPDKKTVLERKDWRCIGATTVLSHHTCICSPSKRSSPRSLQTVGEASNGSMMLSMHVSLGSLIYMYIVIISNDILFRVQTENCRSWKCSGGQVLHFWAAGFQGALYSYSIVEEFSAGTRFYSWYTKFS